jgi:hypothetical protein
MEDRKIVCYLLPEHTLACIALRIQKEDIAHQLSKPFKCLIADAVKLVYNFHETAPTNKTFDLARTIGKSLLEQQPYLGEQVMQLAPETAINYIEEQEEKCLDFKVVISGDPLKSLT